MRRAAKPSLLPKRRVPAARAPAMCPLRMRPPSRRASAAGAPRSRNALASRARPCQRGWPMRLPRWLASMGGTCDSPMHEKCHAWLASMTHRRGEPTWLASVAASDGRCEVSPGCRWPLLRKHVPPASGNAPGRRAPATTRKNRYPPRPIEPTPPRNTRLPGAPPPTPQRRGASLAIRRFLWAVSESRSTTEPTGWL